MGTIKKTDFAHDQATKMLGIIHNELPAVIGKLNSHGQQLSDPNHWDGPLARQFRGEVWPQARADLDKMRGSLEQLQQQVQTILTRISHAGGE
jgi:hypothetical protein